MLGARKYGTASPRKSRFGDYIRLEGLAARIYRTTRASFRQDLLQIAVSKRRHPEVGNVLYVQLLKKIPADE